MRHRIVPTVLVLLALLALAVGCGDDDVATGDDDGAAPTSTPSLSDDVVGAWELSSGTLDGGPVPTVEGYRITMVVEADGSVGGTAACNSYGGDVSIDDGAFTLGDLAWTEMACEPAVMASEQAFLEALLRAERVAVDADQLVLTGDGVELRFSEQPPVPTADLVDTVWELDTLIDGDAASSTMGEPATLELRSDGTLVGSTGCRTLSGTWVESGDEVIATELSAAGDCPDELARQDGHVVEVLADGFTVAIDGQRLTLTSAGDVGLSYRVAG